MNRMSQTVSNDRAFYNLLPSASVAYRHGDFTHTLSYRTVRGYPSFWDLSGNISFFSPYSFVAPNPEIRQSITYAVNYQLNYKWLYFFINYQRTNNPRISVSRLLEIDGELRVRDRPENFKIHRFFGATCQVSPVFGWYEPSLVCNYVQQFIPVQERGVKRQLTHPYFYLYLDNLFVLPKDWRIGINFSYNTKTLDYFTYRNQSYCLDCYVQKSFLDRTLKITLSGNDLLGKHHITIGLMVF